MAFTALDKPSRYSTLWVLDWYITGFLERIFLDVEKEMCTKYEKIDELILLRSISSNFLVGYCLTSQERFLPK